MGFTIQTGNFNQTRMIIEMAPLGAIFLWDLVYLTSNFW